MNTSLPQSARAGDEIASFTVTSAVDADRADLRALLDRIFVAGQQRSPSFAERFPALFTPQGGSRAWVIKDHHTIVSCLFIKRRRWMAADHSMELAMIGGVCTDPSWRGRGLASRLLTHVELIGREAPIATKVLWTTTSVFYERRGWQGDDPGLLGTVHDGAGLPKTIGYTLWVGSPTVAVRRVESIRREWLTTGVVREDGDYATIPFPAQSVECLIVAGVEGEAYALVGARLGIGYVYETVGAPQAFAFLWRSIRGRYATVYINDCSGSQTMRWLSAHAQVEWQPKPLAMWQGQGRCYVPYFDRI